MEKNEKTVKFEKLGFFPLWKFHCVQTRQAAKSVENRVRSLKRVTFYLLKLAYHVSVAEYTGIDTKIEMLTIRTSQ